MKATESITVKRSFCTLVLLIPIGTAGCTTSDNDAGSPGKDSGVADGSGQVARDVQAQPADAPITADAAVPPDASTSAEAGSLGIGRPCDVLANPAPAQAVYNTQALECPSRICLKPRDQVGGVNTGSFCSSECSADSDCVGQTRDPRDPNDKRCAGGYTCAVAFTVGPLTCKKLCLCKDFLADPASVPSDCSSTPADAAVLDGASVGKDAARESIAADAGKACVYPPGSDTATDAGNGSFVGCRPEPTSNMCDPSSYAMTCLGSGIMPVSISQPASGLNCKVVTIPTPSNTLFYCCPCAGSSVPDAAGVGKDAPPASPEAGAAHQCQLNADGTCGAVTPNTACTPFRARRYDESAGCYSTAWTTLWCCATAAGESCGSPAMIGCYQVTTDAGTVTYWTPGLGLPSSAGQACDQSKYAKVTSASPCSATTTDAAASPDATFDVNYSDQFLTAVQGTWLVGSSGGTTNYSWLRLTRDAPSVFTAYVQSGQDLTGNTPFWPCSGQGDWFLSQLRYSMLITFPSSCPVKMEEYVFNPFYAPTGYPKGAILTATITTLSGKTALVGYKFPDSQCNADMTSCIDPL
jgi:hypothetical protein